MLLAPGAALALLALHDGGFFPTATGVAAVAVLGVLVLRAALAPQPFAGAGGRAFAVAAGALGAFAVWTLVSGSWSGAPARAILEYNRVLLYLGVFVLFGVLGRSGECARLLIVGLASAAGLVCMAALAVWLAPDVFPVNRVDFPRYRLSWPTSYWNATGFIAGLAIVFALHLTSSLREARWVRAAAAATIPLAVATLWFTVSRGAAGATALAVVVFLVAGASRGLMTGAPLSALASLAAMAVARSVDNLANTDPSAQALSDGRHAALLLGLIAVLAGSARFGLAGVVDRRVAELHLPAFSRRAAGATAGTVILALALAFIALHGAGRVSSAYHQFTGGEYVGGDVRPDQRFKTLGGNNRAEQWKVALRGLRDHPLQGTGAGAYALAWQRRRTVSFDVIDAHSLYAEQAGELGVVGIGLLALALGLVVAGLAWRVRDAQRTVWAALLAAAVGWLVHAGVDWDWEMPALTLWLFAAGGLALSRPVGERCSVRASQLPARVAAVVACVLLALTPISVGRSQQRLVDALAAFRNGDCAGTVAAALDSAAALRSRPEPLELISYCDVRSGRNRLALRSIDAAVRRDPHNWEFRYAQALVRAAAGQDPRSAARTALRLNPRSALARDALRIFATPDRRAWRRRALAAPLNVPAR